MSHGNDDHSISTKVELLINLGLHKEVLAQTYWNVNGDVIRQDAETIYCPQLSQLVAPLTFDCELLIRNVTNFLIGAWSESSNSNGFVDPVTDNYLQCVREAVNNETHFGIFRSDPRYRLVVETVGVVLAAEYIKIILTSSPFFFESRDLLHRLIEDQNYGNPEVMMVETHFGAATISPLLFRYLKHLSDMHVLLDLFADIGSEESSSLRVAEIGVGFGGQAQTFFAVMKELTLSPHVPLSYMFFDLPEVLLLTEKYLQQFSWIDTSKTSFMLNYLTAPVLDDAASPPAIDLCISNYALSELSEKLQNAYLDRVIDACAMGYILYNSLGGFYGRTALEMGEIIATRKGLVVTVRSNEEYSFRVQPGELIIMNVDVFEAQSSAENDNKLITWKM